MAVSKPTPATTAILAGPRPARAGTASSTCRVTGSSASRGSTGPRARPGGSSPGNESTSITSHAPVTQTAPQSRMIS